MRVVVNRSSRLLLLHCIHCVYDRTVPPLLFAPVLRCLCFVSTLHFITGDCHPTFNTSDTRINASTALRSHCAKPSCGEVWSGGVSAGGCSELGVKRKGEGGVDGKQ